MSSEDHPHPVLAQLPLTVSPFVALPSGVPLPYSYKQLPATLPPSVTDAPHPSSQNASSSPGPDAQAQAQQPAYVTSPNTGHSAHPDQIIANCHALQAHLQKLQDEAIATVQKWQRGIQERELMEKRKVAPGWLDMEQKLLVPERKEETHTAVAAPTDLMDVDVGSQSNAADKGAELDRAFGGLGLK